MVLGMSVDELTIEVRGCPGNFGGFRLEANDGLGIPFVAHGSAGKEGEDKGDVKVVGGSKKFLDLVSGPVSPTF